MIGNIYDYVIFIPDSFNTRLMNSDFFNFLSKLSYPGYLIHLIVIFVYQANLYEYTDYTIFNIL